MNSSEDGSVPPLPPGACDAHCHIFGPRNVFPYAPDAAFVPEDAPKEQLVALHKGLGIDRAVIVQSSCHGFDHGALLDGLRAGGGRFRGVALLDPAMPDRVLDELSEAGVVGFRLNFLPHLGEPPNREYIKAILDRVRGRDWHAEIHVAGSGIADYADMIAALGVPVVIDHMARIDLSSAESGIALDALLRLLDRNDVWVKLSGVDRLSPGGEPPYDPGVELARSLLVQAPTKVLWGTDYPHVNIAGSIPVDRELVRCLGDIAKDPLDLHRLLVTNPEEFFGFPRW